MLRAQGLGVSKAHTISQGGLLHASGLVERQLFFFFRLLKALAVSKALGPWPGRGRTSKK